MHDASLPYYLPVGDEISLFSAAFAERLPVMLKGPTGCGKTRFVQHMAARLARGSDGLPGNLVTVACHEDLTGTDLVGRYLIKGEETVWIDGPLTQAVRAGAICYLDEIVEARNDTIVLIHPLTDHRRILPVEKKGETLHAHEDFLLVISYNPGYQSLPKELKPSTRQRFVAIDFNYPPLNKEAEIIAHEGEVESKLAGELASLGEKIRNLEVGTMAETASTRLLIYAARLMRRGVEPRRACNTAITSVLTDDEETAGAVDQVVKVFFP